MSIMKHAKRTLFVTCLPLMLGGEAMFLPGNLSAQPVLGDHSPRLAHTGTISLFPSVFELNGKGGQGTRQTLTITNGMDRPMTFDLALLDVVTRSGTRLFVPAGELPGSIAATGVLTPRKLLVEAGQTGSAELTLTLPLDTKVRAVVARFQPIDPNAGPGRVGIAVGVGSLITFNITDDVSAIAEPLLVIPPTATTALGFSAWITNDGREPFIVKGTVAILDGRQRLVTRIDLQRTRFLPGERLQLRPELVGELPAGPYRAILTLSYHGRVLTKTADWQNR